jgi:hypothetical protein
MAQELPDIAAKVLGHLYALTAARLNGDSEGENLLRAEMDEWDIALIQEAGVAAAAAAVAARMRLEGLYETDEVCDAFSDMPEQTRHAVEDVLNGEEPTVPALPWDTGEELAVQTLAAAWLWANHGDLAEAALAARRNCVNMAAHILRKHG